MPKINVNDTVCDGFRLEIGWAHEKWVQVATTNAHSKLSLDEDGTPDPFDGWHVTLDRDGINRAIRALREARDKAFGADA